MSWLCRLRTVVRPATPQHPTPQHRDFHPLHRILSLLTPKRLTAPSLPGLRALVRRGVHAAVPSLIPISGIMLRGSQYSTCMAPCSCLNTYPQHQFNRTFHEDALVLRSVPAGLVLEG
jgi:hypothetical protein